MRDLYQATNQLGRLEENKILKSCSNLRRSTSDIPEVKNQILRP